MWSPTIRHGYQGGVVGGGFGLIGNRLSGVEFGPPGTPLSTLLFV